MVQFIIWAGPRIWETIALAWEDVDLKQGTVTFRLNTRSGLPHVNDFFVRGRFFKAHLKAAGVRYRGPGQCRHTYASQLLTTGVASVDWIAEQMGHACANMIRQHYETWINEDGPDIVGLLQHALGL
ncbi:Phage integrase, site-specific tyrosine recombinase [Pseudomonas orientalis]|nr:Phage integrase, site-specific tyrosine recombinase [Pseudomonas orientalis]